jgi:hypothetical protein
MSLNPQVFFSTVFLFCRVLVSSVLQCSFNLSSISIVNSINFIIPKITITNIIIVKQAKPTLYRVTQSLSYINRLKLKPCVCYTIILLILFCSYFIFSIFIAHLMHSKVYIIWCFSSVSSINLKKKTFLKSLYVRPTATEDVSWTTAYLGTNLYQASKAMFICSLLHCTVCINIQLLRQQ